MDHRDRHNRKRPRSPGRYRDGPYRSGRDYRDPKRVRRSDDDAYQHRDEVNGRRRSYDERDWDRGGARGSRERGDRNHDSRRAHDGHESREQRRKEEEELERKRKEEEAAQEEEYRRAVEEQLKKQEEDRIIEEQRRQRRERLEALKEARIQQSTSRNDGDATERGNAATKSDADAAQRMGTDAQAEPKHTTEELSDAMEVEPDPSRVLSSDLPELREGSVVGNGTGPVSDGESRANADPPRKDERSTSHLEKSVSNGGVNNVKSITRSQQIDMFASDDDDDDDEVLEEVAQAQGIDDDRDDGEGYIRFRVGEKMENERYRITGYHGKGVYSQVLKAVDQEDGSEVAIKVSRNKYTMKQAARLEEELLNKLHTDEGTRRNNYIVELRRSFVWQKHSCIVLEGLNLNLREMIKKFGKGVGLSMQAVRVYSKQLLLALRRMKQCQIIHADIKPDNIVVSEDYKYCKLCDFGTGFYTKDAEITPMLVTQYYRPPEVILGHRYNEAVDLWAVGCTIVEMFTGHILFPGRNNNDMLRLHMEMTGRFPNKFVRKGEFMNDHFNKDLQFLHQELDTVVVKPVYVRNATRDWMEVLLPTNCVMNEESLKLVALLKDFASRIFVPEPDKRISVSEALQHPFISFK